MSSHRSIPSGASLSCALGLIAGVIAGLTSGCRDSRAQTPPPASSPNDAREEAAYDRYRRPDDIVAALGLTADMVVADVGAGRGYLTGRLAAKVGPRGKVVATDIDPDALSALAARHFGSPSTGAVETRLVTPTDPGLEPGRYDLILLSEVDHLLPDRTRYLETLARALRPSGRIAITNRMTYYDRVLAAAHSAHLRVTHEATGLPAHFLVILEALR